LFRERLHRHVLGACITLVREELVMLAVIACAQPGVNAVNVSDNVVDLLCPVFVSALSCCLI